MHNAKEHSASSFLPPALLWEFAAGIDSTIYASHALSTNPIKWIEQSKLIHHRATSPAPIDLGGERDNLRGVSDMLGNVWEWCCSIDDLPKLFYEKPQIRPGLVTHESVRFGFSHIGIAGISAGSLGPPPTLRGGSFLDDISTTYLNLNASKLEHGTATCHSDLGFRIAGTLPIECLPDEVQLHLSLCKPYKLFEKAKISNY